MPFSLTHLDALIAERSLLLHPFYQAWSKGELTLEHLRVYAKEYFHLVQRIPGFVASVRDRLEDGTARERLEENEREEREHVELWKRFARSLSITEAELAAHAPSRAVRRAVDQLEATVQASLDAGISALYALERELPAIAATKKDGLARSYGLSSADAQVYFDEHLKEEKHLEAWRAFDVEEVEARRAAEKSMTAQHALLDAVCARCGIAMRC